MNGQGVVAAGHEHTAQAVEWILREGGNAFDAALAGMCAACVTEPVLASLGGGGFLLARTAHGRSSVHDFFVQTPRKRMPPERLDFRPATCDFGEVQQTFHIGCGSVATPGMVRGLFDIHRDLGSIPLREIVAPAIEFARNGIPVTAFQGYIFSIVAPIMIDTPDARAIYESRSTPGKPVVEGELLRQVDLADAFEILSREGADLFYRGEIARAIVECTPEGGGSLSLEDLAHYESIVRYPLTIHYRGAQIATNPPPSSGGILIAFALKLLEQLVELDRHPFGSNAHVAHLALAMEQTEKARVEAHLDEPTACIGTSGLLDEELLQRYVEQVAGRAQSMNGTTHLSVMDKNGNVATVTLSNGAGSGFVVPRTGIMLNNMLGEDDLCPQGFHRWQVDQRMTSMMAPTLLLFRDGRVVATGSGGSKRIRTAILQVLVNLIDYRMGIESAVSSPRIYFEAGKLSVEGGFDSDRLGRVIESYPQHEIWDRLNLYFGGAHTVERTTRGFDGAGDPRRGGVCIVL